MQLALYDTTDRRHAAPARSRAPQRSARDEARLCAACREREARYGFRDEERDDPTVDRPKTLCFDCFRMELDRRRVVAAQRARGWNADAARLAAGREARGGDAPAAPRANRCPPRARRLG